MDELYRIRITVDTDGDFSYDQESYSEEKEFESFNETYQHLLSFLNNLAETIESSRSHIKNSVVWSVNKAIKLYSEEYDTEEIISYINKNGIVEGTIHMGNQEIYWSIDLIEVPRIQITSKDDFTFDIRFKTETEEVDLKDVQLKQGQKNVLVGWLRDTLRNTWDYYLWEWRNDWRFQGIIWLYAQFWGMRKRAPAGATFVL